VSPSNARSRCPRGDVVIEIRPYQEDCVRRIREELVRHRQVNRKGRVVLASPTGSGKTVMFAWLAMAVAAHGSPILILAHRQKIAEQISDALTAFAVPHGIIAPGYPPSGEAVQVAMVLTQANSTR